MGTRVLGLDIGHSTIKGVVLDVAFRNWEIVDTFVREIDRDDDLDERSTPPRGTASLSPVTGPAPDAEAGEGQPAAAADEEADEFPSDYEGLDGPTLATLQQLADEGLLKAESISTNASLEELFLTRVTLPFSGPREVEAVLRPQLEGRLPAEVDEMHIDFMVCGPAPNGEHLIQAAAVQPEHVASWLGSLDSVGLDPRVVDVEPFQLLTTASLAPASDNEAVAWIDIGGLTTGVLVLRNGKAEFARQFPGGGDLVTDALAEAFSLSLPQARAGKHREARIINDAGDPTAPPTAEAVEISEACRKAVQPLIRQIRRTLQSHASNAATPVSRIVLCGGGSMLVGLGAMIEQQLGVPVEHTTPPPAAGSHVLGEQLPLLTGALGLALRGVAGVGGSKFNLRRDAFSFQGNYEWLLMRVPALAGGLGVIALSALLIIAGTWVQLRTERNHLDDALEAATTEIFGTPLLVAERIRQRLDQGAASTQFMGSTSAYDIFVGISAIVGDLQSEGTVIEARSIEVDLSRRLFDVRGIAESADAVDRLETALSGHTCLRNLQRQSLTESRRGEGFDFGITGAASCSRLGDEEGR